MVLATDRCRVCGGMATERLNGVIRGKHHIKYFRCSDCGFLQTEQPYWLREAYSESINASDTGLVQRNLWLSSVTAMVMRYLWSQDATGLDYGGGYGLFVRLMRDKGFEFAWEDPRTTNLFAKGFEYRPERRVDLVTCFEAFEHFEEPMNEVGNMLERGGNVLFSTQLLPEPVPPLCEWWYYDTENGQHIAFYTKKSLERLAKGYGLYLSSAWSIHMFSKTKIPSAVFASLLVASRLGLSRLLCPWRKSAILGDAEAIKKEIRLSRNAGNSKIDESE